MQVVLPDLCADYLTRLRTALRSVEPSDREQIIEDVTWHLHEAIAALPSPSEDDLHEILERLGSPEDIAAATAPDAHSEHRSQRSVALLGVSAGALAMAIGIGIAAITGALGGGSSPVSSRTTMTFVVVPNVMGLGPAQAAGTLQEVGLYNAIDDLNCSGMITRARTVAEAPPPGSKVASGTRISIQVACSA